MYSRLLKLRKIMDTTRPTEGVYPLNIGVSVIKPPQKKSFFLFGPRGTGKTTWVKSIFPKAVYLDLLQAELFNDLLANPQRLENFIPQDFNYWVIIDEVQRVPELLNEVHRLIEKYRDKFILTGSSARKIKRKGPSLLAGRALTYFMHPLTVLELGKDFNLQHSLKYGQLPCVYTEQNPKGYLENYVKTYLARNGARFNFCLSKIMLTCFWDI